MRISKLPIPLLIAAAALTGVAVIYVYLTAPPLPIHTDPNFTTPLFAGGVYLWRGAAFNYILSADKPITVSYTPGYHLIYTTGPLTNMSVGPNRWIVYLPGGRALYVERRLLESRGFRSEFNLVYKLEDVTPDNCTIPDLTIWLPQTFRAQEYLSTQEVNAITRVISSTLDIVRVVDVRVNGTHIIYTIAYSQSDYLMDAWTRLPSPTTGTVIRVDNRPSSYTYTINRTTFTAIALPYLFFSITPSETARVVIYVS
jgi:hypothetical protein